MRGKHLAVAVAVATGIVASRPASADAISDFYTGKQMTMIISTGVGGGVDANARIVAKHWGNHIPGKPTIVPKNMTGAGHLQATNFMYNVAPKDGTHIAAILPSFVLYQKIDGKGAQYDAAKFLWIGGSDVDNMNLYVWHTVPVKTWADAKTQEITMGGTGAGSYTTLWPTLMNNLLGTKFKLVTGYKSTAEIHLAMERGEVQGRAGNFFSSLRSQNPDYVRDHKIIMLVQFGMERDPEFKDTPLLTDLAQNDEQRQIFALFSGELALGRPYLTTPGVPDDRLAALRKSFEETMQDPAFRADAAKADIGVHPQSADKLKSIAEAILGTPPALIEKAKLAKTEAQAH
ncbi:MAG: Bug family tripartite tricarboxylate transporter substrate binding protein [Gemmatimonas sp.]